MWLAAELLLEEVEIMVELVELVEGLVDLVEELDDLVEEAEVEPGSTGLEQSAVENCQPGECRSYGTFIAMGTYNYT